MSSTTETAGTPRTILSIRNLHKSYGEFIAVDDLSLDIQEGKMFGFLGPNGAGKTTTIKIIAGLILPTSGTALIDGHDIVTEPVEAKAVTGFIPDRPFLYEKLTGGEFLQFTAGIYSIPEKDAEERTTELLDVFELDVWRHELIESYSHGMKQRLVMAAAFLHRPRLLIVDEPMVGLDPKGARLVKLIFRKMRDSGTTIFMSTHTLEIAEEMCDRVAIISHGKIISSGTVDQLRAASGSEGQKLEQIFLTLTGEQEEGITAIVEAIKSV
jgi:ABC-2 type transport system ATP-binding protein